MLLVSRWTIHCRVSEFGLTHLSRFSDITDEQLDSKFSAFLNEHGCLVGTSMVLGHLRSYSWVSFRNKSATVPAKTQRTELEQCLFLYVKFWPSNLPACTLFGEFRDKTATCEHRV